MAKNTANKIIEYIKKQKQATANELVDYLGISRQALFKHHLSKMVRNDVLNKIGKPPKVFYLLKEEEKTRKVILDNKIKSFIETNYLIITPRGERKEGWEGFVYWCERTKQKNIKKVATDYVDTMKKYNSFKKNGIISGKHKLKQTFKELCLDELFYVDFYSVERFGKTKLGQLLLYAKQSQNKPMIEEIVKEVRKKIDYVIKKYSIDAVGFIPPTIKRETQLMKELEKRLNLKIKTISITKVKTSITVPQKTLNNLNDRIENARSTIIVEEKAIFNNILLIDDAVGSGATLNETAGQIKSKGLCKKKVIGLAITGSFKGFDVISEV